MSGNYCIKDAEVEVLSTRAEAMSRWLRENAPYCEASQKHLEEGTVERAYWHFGYVSALRDCLRLLRRSSAE